MLYHRDKSHPHIDEFGQIHHRQIDSKLYNKVLYNRRELVFFVHIENSDSLKYVDIDQLIPDDFAKLLRTPDSKVLLIINHPLEGFHDTHVHLYERFILQQNFVPKQVLVISPNLSHAEYNREHAKLLGVDSVNCEIFNGQLYLISHMLRNHHEQFVHADTCNPENITNTYLSLNRRWRPHRPITVALLYSLNILHRGKVSLGDVDNDAWQQFDQYVEFLSDNDAAKSILHQHKNDITKIQTLHVDVDEFSDSNTIKPNTQMQQYYDNTLISLITETRFFDNSNNFWDHSPGIMITEKTQKSIIHKHPFVIAANSGFLHNLRQIGFKTFPEFIDESYDCEKNDALRLIKVVKQIEQVCKWDKTKIEQFCQYAKPITEHNYDVLKNFNEIPVEVL